MLNKEDIKVGQYVKWIGGFKCSIEHIVSVNSQYAYTNRKTRIYPKDYIYYIALSNEEVKAESIHYLNDEIQDLLSNIKDLQEQVHNLANLPYITIDTDEVEQDLGCPLDVVFKALKENYIIFKHVVGLNNPSINLETHKVLGLICIGGKFGLELCDGVFGDEFYVDTKDYGKTWWLKDDKRDNDEC